MKKQILLSTLILSLLLFSGCQLSSGRSVQDSADWPDKTITFICTHAAGGDTDYNTRLLARMLEEELGVSVVVKNVTGSNGAIALEQYKDENPDGYIFVLTNTAALTGNLVTGISDFSYEAFETVAIFGKQSGENILVPADSPYDTLDDLIAASQANPGTIKFGISTGGGVYVASVMMEQTYGAQFNIIDAGDAAERMTSLLGGHVDATVVPYSGAKEYIENGDVKTLCTLLSDRPTLIQDIPTAYEYGYEDLVLDTMYVCLAPSGTDEQIVQLLNEAILRIGENPDFVTENNNFNFQDPYTLSVADSIAELKAQTDRFMKYIDYLQ